MKREYDASAEHDEATSNPAKWKLLFLTFTEFDEDDGEDLNEDNPDNISYCAKDDVSDEEDDDDCLKYLGTEPRARRMVESVNITCWHQWDLNSFWVKDTCKGLLKVLRIKLEYLTDQKRDCLQTILVQILEQANITNIFLMGSDVPGNLSLHKLWHKAWVTRLAFIHFHPHGERLSGNIMGIQRIHNSPALRHKQVMPKSFCPQCFKYGRNTTTIVNHIWQDHYKLGMVCPQCKSYISMCHEDLKSHLIQCRKGGDQRVGKMVTLGISAPFL